MNESPSKVDYEGPSRETAQTMLRRQIAALRQRADGLEALLVAIEAMPAGGLAEATLWEVLCAQRARQEW